MADKFKFNRYILKYLQMIPLDDVAELKARAELLTFDCELQNIGSDNKAYYLCEDVVVGRNKEIAMRSAENNYPEVPRNRMMLFDMKGKQLKV